MRILFSPEGNGESLKNLEQGRGSDLHFKVLIHMMLIHLL